MEIQNTIIFLILIDVIILIISEILMKKYLKKKVMFPKTRLIKSSGVTNDDLDINNSVFLHMTDGIIAFDRDGKIILINPAAKKLMNVLPEHTTFDDIFGRLHLNINLEKIIYLENWTNTEEIVNEIEAGIKKTKGNYKVVVDRTEAIKEAIEMATKLDIIVLAGKGHEPYQEINEKKYPYDERIIVKEIIG